MGRFAIGLGVIVLFLPGRVAAQVERYDLGRRLRALERAWDDQPDAAARKRALPVIQRAVPLFFAGRAAEAAATLDQSRFLLRSADEPPPAVRWAESLVVRPADRLRDPAKPLAVTLLAGYDSKADPPAGAVVRLSLRDSGPSPLDTIDVQLGKHPVTTFLTPNQPPEGDHTLRAEVDVGDKVLATYVQTVSVAPQLHERLARLQAAAKAEGEPSTDRAALRSLTDLLDRLAQRHILETDYPAARLLAEAEALAKAVAANERFYGPQRPGEFWLTLPIEGRAAPVRVFVPEAVKAGKPVPLVVALHGAGGTENLFFDAYGNGKVVRLAKERGWMVVATRAGGLFGGAPPVPGVIDALARLYPVDRSRVYVVGHSMGAAQAVTQAQQAPGRLAAVALLGGGGNVRTPAAVKDLPIFIGCGRADFALGGAKSLAQALEKAGATRVTFKEYPDVEHLLIVQEALPDVFDFFEASRKK
jgi:predicted esterase